MSRPHKCLVITADGVPVDKVSAERAIVHVMQQKAYILLAQEGKEFRSQHESWPVPAVIGLLKYIKLPDHYYGAANLSVNALLKRDNWTCQYCGRKKHELDEDEILTRDHVLPVSRGGEDKWENVVVACLTCNNKKGDKTPLEAGMKLKTSPYAPTRAQLHRQFHQYIEKVRQGHISSEELVDDDDTSDLHGDYL